ncbi:MAG: arginine deiminase family protein, partial [Ardenticatenales bacterium]
MSRVHIGSDIDPLEAVIVHEPGIEIENVTPLSAAEALYDDILFLAPAQAEHRQMTAVLSRVATVLTLTDLLTDVLADAAVRSALIASLCQRHACADHAADLAALSAAALAAALIHGVPERANTLARHIDPSRFALPPLANAFFTRDPAFCLGDTAYLGAFAQSVRAGESDLMRAVLAHHPAVDGAMVDLGARGGAGATIEGGDVIVVRDDLLVVGWGERTSIAGVDTFLAALCADGRPREVVLVALPSGRATFHLDKIFTLLDRDVCVVYPPLVTGGHGCRVSVARLDGGAVRGFTDASGLLDALRARGADLTAIPCGGDDPVRQDREQWSCGTNLLALAPGKVLGYGRNEATYDALAGAGFRVASADDVIDGRVDPRAPGRLAIALDGSECLRGGGGARCMTLPITRT